MTDKLVTPYSNRITIAKAINALASGEAGGGDGVDFTPAEKTKLAGIEKESTKNRADSANADKTHKHVLDDVAGLSAALSDKVAKSGAKVLTDENYSKVDKTKLDGVAVGATKNRADSANADKVHKHALADVTGLVAKITELESRLDALEAAGV